MIDADERVAMQATVRSAITEALAQSEAAADVDEVLAKLGWLEMLGDEPGEAIGIVFGALGATKATATVLDDVIVSALGHAPRADLAVLLPRFARWDPPGRIEGDRVRAQGLATGRVASATELLIVCGTEAAPSSVVVPATSADVQRVGGVDPTADLYTLRVRGASVDAARVDPAAWRSAIALGRRAVAHQTVGISRTMLDLARTHALERVQFGRPIARFQAVRHRLAEALVAVESAESALTAAREDPNVETAALAKAIAGRTAHTVGGHCQQVLAGVGFTTGHPFHRFLKRSMALEGLFGGADAIVLEVGRELLATRRVPTLIEL
jgi:hypothetical protein